MDKSAKLISELRKELCSITIEEIDALKEPQLTEAEYNGRANDCEIFYTKYVERVLKAFIQQQLESIGKDALNMEQVMFGRGTINGFYLLDEWFKNQINISRARFNPEEKAEPGEVA
jgi:hypothetical protein